jgi:hypothetical protein
LGPGDEHVYFGFGAIANVVDERDLGPEKIIETVVAAVEKHFDSCRGCRDRLLSAGIRGRRRDDMKKKEHGGNPPRSRSKHAECILQQPA